MLHRNESLNLNLARDDRYIIKMEYFQIIQVKAEDSDEGKNQELVYLHESGYDGSLATDDIEPFVYVDLNHGTLFSAMVFDRENISQVQTF